MTLSTLIRSADFEDLAASHRDTSFRAISSEVYKPAQAAREDKLPSKFTEAGGISFGAISGAINKEIRKVPGGISFGAILGIDKAVEKDKVQGKVMEPQGQVINVSRPPSDGTPWHLRPQYAD